MDQEKKPSADQEQNPSAPAGEQTPSPPPPPADQGEGPEKKPYKPNSRKARLLAWVGIAFMVFLVLMYTYAFSSGIILKY